ncbi:phage tail length tape measure family protein, partial [Acinetobacter baumannii]
MAKVKLATGEVTTASGQMRFAMRDLSYQINDIATMFAMGASPMMIFASQGCQVFGALSMMTGEATGLLGVLGSPWTMIAMSAAMALGPLI